MISPWTALPFVAKRRSSTFSPKHPNTPILTTTPTVTRHLPTPSSSKSLEQLTHDFKDLSLDSMNGDFVEEFKDMPFVVFEDTLDESPMPDSVKSIDIPAYIPDDEQETSSTQQMSLIAPELAETEIRNNLHSSISPAFNIDNEATNSDTESTHSDESYYGEIHIQPPPPEPKLDVYRDPGCMDTAPSLEVPAHILRLKTRTTNLESLCSSSNKDIIPGSNIALNDQENWARSLQSNFLIYTEEKKHRQTESQIGWGSIPPQKSLASWNKDRGNRRKTLAMRRDNPAFDQENRPVNLGRRESVHVKMPRQPLGLRNGGKKRIPLGEIKLQVSVPPVLYLNDRRESMIFNTRHNSASPGYMRSTISAEGKRREKTPGKNGRVD